MRMDMIFRMPEDLTSVLVFALWLGGAEILMLHREVLAGR